MMMDLLHLHEKFFRPLPGRPPPSSPSLWASFATRQGHGPSAVLPSSPHVHTLPGAAASGGVRPICAVPRAPRAEDQGLFPGRTDCSPHHGSRRSHHVKPGKVRNVAETSPPQSLPSS